MIQIKTETDSHSLRIHTGRYGNDRLPRNELIRVYCKLNDIDDELNIL